MIYDELLDKVKKFNPMGFYATSVILSQTLDDVIKLHKPQDITLPNGEWGTNCVECDKWNYPCLTIEVIGKRFL